MKFRKIKSYLKPTYFELRRMFNNVGRSFRYRFYPKKDIKIAISTVVGYSEQTIPTLVNSLKENGFLGESIYVFEGGHRGIDYSYDGYHYYKVDHNSFDLNGLITINELNIGADYWLLLHDTLELGKKFRKMVYSCQFKRYMGLKLLKEDVSMNIGFYSMSLIKKYSDFLISVKNTDYSENGLLKAKERGAVEEDFILKNSENIGYIHQDLEYLVNWDYNVMYKGRLRKKEYYPQFDMTKYKANCNIGDQWIIKL